MEIKRIRIAVLYAVIFIGLIAIVVFAYVRMNRLNRSLESMEGYTEEYIDCQQAVYSMREASDYLTQTAREYVVNGDESPLQEYLEEIQVTRRREKAMEVLSSYSDEGLSYAALAEAVESSDALAEVEMYAMRLTAEAYGMPADKAETYFAGIELSDEDAALSAEEQKAMAVSMLFDEHYQEMKRTIMNQSLDSLGNLIETIHQQQADEYNRAAGLMKETQVLFFVVNGMVALALILSVIFIVAPVARAAGFIREQKELPTRGAVEYVYLADAYNRMLRLTHENEEALSYEATHDELTGLYNRKAFENAREELVGEQTALLIIDVDRFKQINDTYGHDKGDDILRKVAASITESFRLEDYSCRIGGDEFAVIMRNMDPALADIVQLKMDMVREKLAKRETLPVTLSIGAAFSGGISEEELFKHADLALYSVKTKGGDGYAFYDEGMSEAE